MFYLGDWDEQKVITHYIEHNDIRKVLVVHSRRLYTPYEIGVEHEFIEYSQTIMYKNYYRLLQWIDKYTLIIVDNILLYRNRYQLEYNCINNYINQTPHRLVFNYLPFIEDKHDFMILLDFYNKNKYKGEPFVWEFLRDVKTFIKPVHFKFTFTEVEITGKEKEKYEKEKEKRFAEIGLKDPITIPNNLAITSGDFRGDRMRNRNIQPEAAAEFDLFNWNVCTAKKFTARNRRFKGLDVTTYKDDELNTILDFPLKRVELIDLLTLTKKTDIEVVTSDLSIDRYQKKDIQEWVNRLEEFYHKTTMYKLEG